MTIRKVTNRSSTIDVSPASVSDVANTSTGGFDLPSGTTAQRPGSALTGSQRYNTDLEVFEFYDGTSWKKISAVIPSLASISGDIKVGFASTLTLTGVGFLISGLVVNFEQTSDNVNVNVTVTPSSDGAATVTVPSSVYSNVTANNVVAIKVTNSDNQVSSVINKTAFAAPTGGTITTTSNYRYHAFTTSSTFVTQYDLNADIVVVAGGGGGGSWVPGGGGAGGLIDAQYSSAAIVLNGTHSITVGAGGTGTINPGGYSWSGGTRGQDSYIEKSGTKILTAAGGGRGGSYDSNADGTRNADSGGSGGGRGQATGAGSTNGAGIQTTATTTPGQSNAMSANSRTYGFGADGGSSSSNEGYGQHGGGGASGTLRADGDGQNGRTIAWLDSDSRTYGTNSSNSATSGNYFAGGGGAGGHSVGIAIGEGGNGGGGNGLTKSTSKAPSGLANTGGGGGGGGNSGGSRSEGGNGGSGIVIIRYPI